jgi:hypothetical protein
MYMSSSPHEKVGDDVSEYHDEGLLTIGTPDPMPGGFRTWDDYDGRGLNQSRARSSAAASWSLFFVVGGSKTDGDPPNRKKEQPRSTKNTRISERFLSYGPRWAHYLGGYQDRLLGGPLGLLGLRYTAPDGVEHKDYGSEEKYSVRKLYMSRTVWKTTRCTRLVLSPYSDL